MLRSLLNNALRSGATGAGRTRSTGYGSRGAVRGAGYGSRGAASTGGLGGSVARTVLGRLTRGR